MCPPQTDGLLWLCTHQQSVEQPGGKPVPAPHPVVDIQFASRRSMGLAVDPGYGSPAMPVGRMDFPQCGRDNLDLRIFASHLVDHSKESAGVQFGFGCDLRSGNPEAQLEVLLIPN